MGRRIGKAICLLVGGLIASLPGIATAGHYEVTYGGSGYVSIQAPSGFVWGHGYADSYDAWGSHYYGAAEVSKEEGVGGVSGPGAVIFSGEIVITFTWVPDTTEPPPAYAVLSLFSGASFAGDNGECDNDLGDPPVGGQYAKYSSGTKRIVVALPGQTHVEYISPTAWATLHENVSGNYHAQGSVWINATLAPIDIEVHGAIFSEGKWCLLPGQLAAATVSAAGVSLDSFAWDFNGNLILSNGIYEKVDYGTYGFDQELGPYYESRQYDLFLSSTYPECYFGFDVPVEGQLSCLVHVYYGGEYIGSAIAATTVKVLEPYYYHAETQGMTEYVPNAQSATSVEAAPGIQIEARVGTPHLFASQIGTGVFSFGQLVDVFKEEVVSGTTIEVSNTYGEFMLDNSFPYAWPYGPWEASSTAGSRGPLGSTNDWPSLGLVEGATSYHIRFQAKMFLMWQPPAHPAGYGVEWAPLHRIDWWWNVDGSRSANGWNAPVGAGPGGDDLYKADGGAFPLYELAWWHAIHNSS
jgi:hypothetical protein